MGVVHVQFEWQDMGGCSGMRVFSPLPGPKIAKIKENIMISLIDAMVELKGR
jgi:hypothetical protein